MPKPKLSPAELQAIEAIKGVIAVAESNFPAETTVKISAVGDNHASIMLPDYVLLAIINAAEDLISERDEAREALRPPLKAFWGDEVLCDRHRGGPPMWGTIANVETHYSFGEDRAPYHIYAVRFGQNRRREWHSDDAIHAVRRAALSHKPAKSEGE